jgi:hypothetical protein
MSAPPFSASSSVDAPEHVLRARIGGEVPFDRGTRAAYSADASVRRAIGS